MILSISSREVYREFHLPVLNDADFQLCLTQEEFGLQSSLILNLETLGTEWQLKSGEQYSVIFEKNEREKLLLKGGQFISIRTSAEEGIAILVWDSAAELSAFRKYRVSGSVVTIGRDQKNDICYSARGLITHEHAKIRYENGRAILCDESLNGTYVNGRHISREAELAFGDLINMFGLSIIYLGQILAINWLGFDTVINQDRLTELTAERNETEGSAAGKPSAASDAAEDADIIHISPRNLPVLYADEEVIDGVPERRDGDGRPAWMSILPSFTMVLPMIAGFLLMNGGLGFGIVISGGAAVVGTLWGIINYRYAVQERRNLEKRRQERYEHYLVECSDRIRHKFDHNRQSLLQMYPDAASCCAKMQQLSGLWERKPHHDDFLRLRMGLGDLPFQVRIKAPVRGFTMTDDELSERPQKIVESYSVIRDVPINIDLFHHHVVGILSDGNREAALALARTMISQLTLNHCYTDVKLAVLFSGEPGSRSVWDYTRWFPHVWNEEHSMRYVAGDANGMDDVIYTLTQVFRNRAEALSGTISGKPNFAPYYVVFVDGPELLESQMISKYLFEAGAQLGVTTVLLSDRYELLPSACDFIVECSPYFSGAYGLQKGDETRQRIRFDQLPSGKLEDVARRMSSLRVNQLESGSNIPSSLTFFEMMGIHRPDEIDVLEQWRKNRTYETMRAAIGQKMGNQLCYLDIHEKHHGPHGLVAGTTGSGKSETLQTYILSLAMSFSPQDVGFFIIDFKGGGMANLFSGLPHLIGKISNLSGNQVRRAMVSIKSENQRRQRIFAEYGVNHINAYTKLVKNREATVPIPHLLIIIDEFAELKREQPEFMRELISVAQTGRSLGVHLILATQKPSGTVDENIWSNTKFKLCLRVADKQDSADMLHKPDAAYLTQAGRGYLQVGNDELYELFQSGWSGAPYDESGENAKSGAALLDMQGREPVSASKGKSKSLRKQTVQWISLLLRTLQAAAEEMSLPAGLTGLNREQCVALTVRAVQMLNAKETVYMESRSNLRLVEEVLELLPGPVTEPEKTAEILIERFQRLGKKLPERVERTQLDAVVSYLADLAARTGMINEQMLWMPLLPEKLALTELQGYSQRVFSNGTWQRHEQEFALQAYVGLADDPEHQQQFPVIVDLADLGHLAVVGSVSSGKSTFLQTFLFSLVNTYSPEELNIYAVDYSSQMLCAFEGDAHVGGVVIEGEDEKLDKLFVMLADLLQQRKALIRGGSFGQFVSRSSEPLPAVVLVIDGYANFNEKTESRYESQLLELSRTAEGYGIYLVIACGGFGSGELQMKIAGNIRQSICLELGDKYLYADALRVPRFDVLPEVNIKGRGLALVDGSVLEYQTALACIADNDYDRGEKIRERCAEMSVAWKGSVAAPIPMIPEKPTWQEFRSLPAYHSAIRSGHMLPIAYYKETAALYSVDLRSTFFYLVLGSERSGKSTFLRNLMCAASELGGKSVLIDLNHTDDLPAGLSGVEHITDLEGFAQTIRDLVGLTNERGAVRKRLRAEGLDDEELYGQMATRFPPVFYFVSDLKPFIDAIYRDIPGIGKPKAHMENISAKGELLNVYFFASAGLGTLPQMMDKVAYLNFIRGHRGALLGVELSKQNLFQYQNIRYSDQGKRYKAGICYATNQADEQNVDLIVVPNNRKTIQQP